MPPRSWRMESDIKQRVHHPDAESPALVTFKDRNRAFRHTFLCDGVQKVELRLKACDAIIPAERVGAVRGGPLVPTRAGRRHKCNRT